MTNNQELKPLLPCPFCGSKPKLTTPTEIHKHWYWIRCDNDCCGVNPMTHHSGDLEYVVNSWNTRSQEGLFQVADAMCEALKFYEKNVENSPSQFGGSMAKEGIRGFTQWKNERGIK